MNMKIVFFTNKCSHGAELLKAMKNRDIQIEAIYIEIPSSKEYAKKVKRAFKRGGLIKAIKVVFKTSIKRFMPRTVSASTKKKEWLNNDFYKAYSRNVSIVDNFNGKQCEKSLEEIKPDLIVLGGSRIIHKNIIRIPKIGILNAHPGLLPKYRGVDVIPWAIYNRDDIGVSVHFIDEGVDTGGIITQKVIEIKENDSLGSLRKKAECVAGELMAETVLRIIALGHVPVTQQSKEDGKQYYKMPRNLVQETEKRLKQRMYEQKSD